MARVFSTQVRFLVDFYHTSEYLSKAAEHSWAREKESWRKKQQERLKQGAHQEVLEELRRSLPITG